MIFIMLGAPGTGKGTVASILSEKMNIPQISTGDIFRKHIKEKTELGILADEYISKGQLVPDEVTVNLVKSRLEEPDAQNGVILDGFPRTVKQAEELEKVLKEKQTKLDKAVYNVKLSPPIHEGICDKCGHELIKRKDDNIETIKSRLQTYFEQTSPLIDFYNKKGNLRTEEVSKKINRFGKDIAEDIVKEFLK